jgi:F420H(2)-dependent quinone reductase
MGLCGPHRAQRCAPLYDLVPMKRRLFVGLNRVINVVVRRLRLRRFRGADLLYLTTTGRKSGKQHTTPLLYLRDGDSWVVVASNGGADWQPGWWLNLQSGSSGTVEIDRKRTAVTGSEIVGAERETMWQTLIEKVFDYQKYQDEVSRQLALVRLSPTA